MVRHNRFKDNPPLSPMHAPSVESIQSLLARGDVAGAERDCHTLIAATPHDPTAHALLGHVLRRQQRDIDARSSLQRAVALAPTFGQAWKDLAIVELRGGNGTAGEIAARHARACLPDDPWPAFMHGHALSLLRRHAEAETAFSESLRGGEPMAQARLGLAQDALARKDLEDASFHAAASVGSLPQSPDAWSLFGEVLVATQRMTEATAAFRQALHCAPDDAATLDRLAQQIDATRVGGDELVEIRQRQLARTPDSSTALQALGLALVGAQRQSEALDVFATLREREPDNLLARWMGFQLPAWPHFHSEEDRQAYRANWIAGLAWFEALDLTTPEHAIDAQAVLGSVPNYTLAYLGEADVDLHGRHARVVRRLIEAAAAGHVVDAAIRPITRNRRRIGVISHCLRKHSVTRAWGEAILALPRKDFELQVFYTGTTEDASVERFRQRADRFQSGSHTYLDWSQQLHAAELDIAIFLDIGMDVVNQLLASVRFAPVQVATWAHPVTTGMPTIDCFLSADLAEPADAAAHYSETLVRLPRLGGCFPLPRFPLPQAPVIAAQSDGTTRLICLQNLAKLHPGHDVLFTRIAAAVPQARFTVMSGAPSHHAEDLAARLHAAARRAGVDPSRFRVLPLLGESQYWRELAAADIVLDSLDFSGAMTTLDALWHDRPVITLPGALMRGRQTYAMLRLLDLDELIARDMDDYVRRAVLLASEPARRADIVRQIAQRKHRLFEDRSVCTALADFLRTVEPHMAAGAQN